MLQGKKIIVGVTGSIAAYKAAILVRMLVKEGAQVKVIMTPLAKAFITPLTMATLSKNPILVDFFDPENGQWNSHVNLGEWADAYVIAPATANTIGKMAHGIADNLLLTTYLSARCPVFVSPAMDLDMYAHPSTARNLSVLKGDGVRIIEPQSGELASGLCGKGRMEEPENIVGYLRDFFVQHSFAEKKKSLLTGKKVLITAGGSIEPIDPVRYISNYSSGKMGFALADAFAARGAQVALIKARTDPSLKVRHTTVTETTALSAAQMYDRVMEELPSADIIVMAAAVADFSPKNVPGEKIKKEDGQQQFLLEFIPTKDIAAEAGKRKRTDQVLVGFALETHDGEANAKRKMEVKNLDFIVLNNLLDEGAGFNTDTNKVTIYFKNGSVSSYPLMAKSAVAEAIADEVEKICQQQ